MRNIVSKKQHTKWRKSKFVYKNKERRKTAYEIEKWYNVCQNKVSRQEEQIASDRKRIRR